MKINERFTAVRDEWCWHLHETYTGSDKDGNPKDKTKTTYHANVSQVFDYVLDKQIGNAESLPAIAQIIERTKAEFAEQMASAMPAA